MPRGPKTVCQSKVVLRTALETGTKIVWSLLFKSYAALAPKMAPSWRPRRSQKQEKIEKKNVEILKASWKAKFSKKIDFGGQPTLVIVERLIVFTLLIRAS